MTKPTCCDKCISEGIFLEKWKFGCTKESCPCHSSAKPAYGSLEEAMKEFDELDIQVSPPRSLADKETVEKLKYFCPIAWDLFKPSIRSFISSVWHSARLARDAEVRVMVEDALENELCQWMRKECYSPEFAEMKKNDIMEDLLASLAKE